MPLYEYRCSRCGASFERIEHVPGRPTMPCPRCGHNAQRQLGVPVLVFKGHGWYVTDYAKKSRPAHESS
jgi:putative FmdB family regulatory protein